MPSKFITSGEERFLRLIRGETRGALAELSRLGLHCASGIYGVAASARNLAFDLGIKKSGRASIPVVSIGNLTLGGTGKTPMVEYAARWYRSQGVRVAIVSRGYGKTTGLNDEGLVLQQNLPDVPHLQGRDRVKLAELAVDQFNAQLIVLDDGFQHRRLARDLDIVLLDALGPFGLDHVFPRGLLREPIASLARAHVVVLSRADLISSEDLLWIRKRAEAQAGSLHWVDARQAPLDLIDSEGRQESLSLLKGRRIAAFCGIGNPSGFRKTLQALETNVVGFRTFADHYAYSSADITDLANWGVSFQSELLLTTQKDLVKLRDARFGPLSARALRIGFEPLGDASPLETALAKLLPAARGTT